MVERNRLTLLASLGAAVLVPGVLAGCVVAPRDDHDRGHPPHYYDYYYYPQIGVYFHLYSGYYYYHRDNRWYRTRDLPDRYRLNPGHRRLLVIRDEEPWRHNEEHRRTYGPPSGRDDRGRDDRGRDDHGRDEGPDWRRDRDERTHNREQYEEYKRRR